MDSLGLHKRASFKKQTHPGDWDASSRNFRGKQNEIEIFEFHSLSFSPILRPLKIGPKLPPKGKSDHLNQTLDISGGKCWFQGG